MTGPLSRARRKILLATGLFWLASLIVGVALAGAAPNPPGMVPGLVSTTHPNPLVWYPSPSPSFTWNAAPQGTYSISGYSLVLDQNADTVPIVSGSGVNSFQAQVPYAVGSSPAEDRVADVNGDGKLDIIAENSGSNTVSVLLGNGDGTFRAAVNYATPADPWSMDLGDVNGDGRIDIVTCNETANNVSVLLGNSDGTFQAAVNYTTGASSSPEAVRLGDVNGDGKLDIVTANAASNNNTISVLRNNGDGTFGSPATFGTATHPTSIAFGDLNGDGKLDIVTANYDGNSVSVLLGHGDGTFQSAANYACGNGPQTVVVADLNGDGKPDVATVNYGPSNASVLLNRGDGTGTLLSKVDYAVGTGPYSLSAADLNHDGVLDLVSVNHTANSVSILYGNGNGTFAAKYDLATGNGPFWVALGNFDSSGYDDLAVTDASDNKVGVLLGTELFRAAASTLAASFSAKADGFWYLHVRAVDTMGNGGLTSTCRVRIDTTSPVTTQTGADGAWHNTPVTVNLAGSDASSGVATTEYDLDGGGWTIAASVTVPAPLNGTKDGTHTIQYRSTDAAGNLETAKSCTVKIDASGPTTTAAGLQSSANTGWTKITPQGVTLAATDGGSGMSGGSAAIYYRIDSSGAYSTYGSALSLATPGSHKIDYYSVDALGNAEAAQTGYVNIDTTAPVTTAAGLVVDRTSSWQNAAGSFTLTAADATSSVATTNYTIDGGGTVLYGGGTVPVSGDASHVVTYWSTDAAGNVEETHTAYLNIDATPPATTASGLTAGADTGWTQTTPHNVTLAATDGGSGMSGGSAAIYYRIDSSGAYDVYSGPLSISTPGSHTVDYYSVDVAGNTETPPQTGYVNIDTTAPTTTATGLAGSATSGWTKTTPQSVTLTASDAQSGVAATCYTIDAGDQRTYGGAFDISDSGSHTITYWSVDAAGNAETPPRTGYVNIDTTAPTTTATGLVGSATGGWTKTTPQSVTLTAADSDSGMSGGGAAIYYRIDSAGDYGVYSGPFTIAAPGSHEVDYYSVDALGNLETSRAGYVNIDTTPPSTTQSGADDAWHATDVPVSFSADDHGLSGVARTEYRVDPASEDDPWTTGATMTVRASLGDGVHTVEYRSVDGAGNTAPYDSCTVKIDTQQPVTIDNATATWHAVPFTLELTASGLSGATTQYSIGDDLHWQSGNTLPFTNGWKRGGGSGPTTVYYRSTNGAGLIEAEKSCVVLIDTSRPSATDDAPQGPQSSDVTVHLTGHDTFSGVAGTFYQLDGGTWTAGASVYVPALPGHANDGLHTIRYYAIDNAGNVETGYRVCTVRITTP